MRNSTVQSVDIIQDLVDHLKGKTGPQLVIVTDISSFFFDRQLANEDPEFPVLQLQLMQQSVGVLQHLAIQNNIIVISNKNTRTTRPGWLSSQEVQAASLL